MCSVNAAKRDMQAIHNPFDNTLLAELPIASASEALSAVADGLSGAALSRELSRADRAAILTAAAASVEDQLEDFAEVIVSESGKTIRQARLEVSRCINTLTLSAEEAKRLAGELIPFDACPGSENRLGFYRREPLGLILGITPYNDPLNLAAHKIAPAIASGNAIIIKPSELAPLSALKLADALYSAGCPLSCLKVVFGNSDTGRSLVASRDVRMVSFTGGVETAETIKQSAGLKRLSMDLGGNAPVIVAHDGNIDHAVAATVSGAFWAAGQNCIGVQRILVHGSIADEFVDAFVESTSRLVCGNPRDESTDIGPMITATAAELALAGVRAAKDEGATILCGGKRDGAVLQPTVLENVAERSLIRCEEVFAPIVMIDRFDDYQAAIDAANSPQTMLHAGIFTESLETAFLAIDGIEAAGIMVNDSSDYRLDAMPFGGFKYGSMGREGVRFAMEEMTQTKVVCFNRYTQQHEGRFGASFPNTSPQTA